MELDLSLYPINDNDDDDFEASC